MCNFVKVRTHDGAILSISYEKLSRLLGYNPKSRVLNVYADGSIGFGKMLNRAEINSLYKEIHTHGLVASEGLKKLVY